MNIRDEDTSDFEGITKITKAAFKNHPFSQQTEQFIILGLRAANALTVSLVAEIDGEVVGHLGISPVTISDGSKDWYGLGPISVEPEYQRQGIGKALVKEGLNRLKGLKAQGCILVGDPGYYEKFGFRSFPELRHEGVPQENVLALPFGKNVAQGSVVFHESFSATE